jgi:hypothetical protein
MPPTLGMKIATGASRAVSCASWPAPLGIASRQSQLLRGFIDKLADARIRWCRNVHVDFLEVKPGVTCARVCCDS